MVEQENKPYNIQAQWVSDESLLPLTAPYNVQAAYTDADSDRIGSVIGVSGFDSQSFGEVGFVYDLYIDGQGFYTPAFGNTSVYNSRQYLKAIAINTVISYGRPTVFNLSQYMDPVGLGAFTPGKPYIWNRNKELRVAGIPRRVVAFFAVS